ncbi:MAG: aminomethyl-transferring glycine dehydrogenase subunit GcvPA [Nitrospirae bacterium]|nr:aminomethyl-transferring glycine dehydrogenase subunit GcvPA [Candidatus Manganitrophaceae bacterium]
MEYIPKTPTEEAEMLEEIGVASFDDLLEIPAEFRLNRPLHLPKPLSQMALKREMSILSRKNRDTSTTLSFLGGGSYDHFIPSTVGHVIGRSEFYSAYTPYQAELSQGLLQTIYEYQSMICQLTDMEVSGASLYDGASALAEAALMAIRITKRSKILVSESVHPHHRAVIKTYLSGLPGAMLEDVSLEQGRLSLQSLENAMDETVAAVLIQYPNFYGQLESAEKVEAIVHAKGGLLVMAVDPISLGVLKTPGEFNADIAVGEGQALGNAQSFGGPYMGFFATRKKMIRQLPGRIVGATTDVQGRAGFCLTLQTREQHIKRERATSNICTNQALNALAASVYLATVGKKGLREVASLCLEKSHAAQEKIAAIPGFSRVFEGPFFKEFVVKTPKAASEVLADVLKEEIFAGIDLGVFDRNLSDHLLICLTEKHEDEDIDRLVLALSNVI